MEFTPEQRKIIKETILLVDEQQPAYDRAMDAYFTAKRICTYGTVFSLIMLTGLAFLVYTDVTPMISYLHVTLLLGITLLFPISFMLINARFNRAIRRLLHITDPLSDMGLSYVAVGVHHEGDPWLWVIDTKEDLDVDSFLK